MSWVLSVVLAAMAAAPKPGQNIMPGEALPLNEVRKTQQSFSRCVVARRAAVAERYVLAIDLDQKSRAKLIQRLTDPDCLAPGVAYDSARMRFPGDTMRYALADALVRLKLKTSPLVDVEKVPPISHPKPSLNQADLPIVEDGKALSPQQIADLRAKAMAAPYLSRLGECVVRFNPQASHELLMAEPESAAETAQFRTIKPALANCVEEGRSLELNKMIVRGTIALAYYRLAKAPRDASALTGTVAGSKQ
jgi:hypothetical protein